MTTVLALIRHDKVAMGSDGQMTLGDTIFKHKTKKVRRIYNGQVLAGFAGSTADAIALLERFEKKLQEFSGNLLKASVELAKEWRTDRALRQLQAMLIVANKNQILVISGNGDVIQPDDNIAAIGSGGPIALAVAKALYKHTNLTADQIVKEAIEISGEISIYSNQDVYVETIE
ncbi:MAG: ATP-dependent protease subunit HslV [Candidatus Calescibacterium sp.]|nr:ATP-dependent protease subunit HslV [Candidatus Calescibacterium sp.]MCX7733978.1 ATP-dependent protease subunit HslV [bacterium]MDW8086423.1 ATP-dependent protease subunit HslV [Candidatus Calescibacterium sp.]